MKTKIYVVKEGYHDIATFERIEDATTFFTALVRGAGKRLEKVGKGDKEAAFFSREREFTMSVDEVDLYKTEKEAKFAAFEGNAETAE